MPLELESLSSHAAAHRSRMATFADDHVKEAHAEKPQVTENVTGGRRE